MLRDYFALGCDGQGDSSEVWNHARLRAYVDAGFAPAAGWTVHGCSCPTLEQLLTVDGEGGYTYPSDPDNPAPWYDPEIAESADFSGFLALEVEGLEDSPFYRNPKELLTGGHVLGPERMRGREIRVRGILLGRTCCSIDLGMRWLLQALRGCVCQDSCGGDVAEVLRCCPGSSGSGCAGPAEGSSGLDEGSFSEFLSRSARCLRNVGLVEGPTVVERYGSSCGDCGSGCELLEVEFTLMAGDPWLYTAGSDVITEEPFPEGTDDCTVEFVECEGDACNNCHRECDPGCEVGNPDCRADDPPTYAAPEIGCLCEPIETETSCFTIDDEILSEWFEAVPVIEVYAGSAPIENLRFRFHPNPAGRDCSDFTDHDGCEACGEIVISYLEAFQTITIDGRDRTSTVTCPGGTTTSGAPVLFGDYDGSSAISWPVLTCSDGYCVCIQTGVHPNAPADDAHYSITLFGREAS